MSFCHSSYLLLLFLILSCSEESSPSIDELISNIKFENIDYYLVTKKKQEKDPSKSRITYYFDNGLPHRYIVRDSTNKILTDFIYQYNDNWVRTGARYKEEIDSDFAVERLKYSDDSMKVTTEWLNDNGEVYYRMIEELDSFNRVFRASFIGDELHGYDTTFYTKEGFEKRIFFTNVKGKVLNDRQFNYLEIDEMGDWTKREKIMGDTVQEIQIRKTWYDDTYINDQARWFDGIISIPEASENYISFTSNEENVFFTRGEDWQKQIPYISKKIKGIYTTPQRIEILDTIYNGAISLKGDQIIYATRGNNNESIWLTSKVDGKWQEPTKLKVDKGLYAGYFQWIDEDQLYFYVEENNGDLVKGQLDDYNLSITEKLDVLNTEKGTEFSPFVEREKRFIIFTRYVEGDLNQQGFFISYNKNDLFKPKWSDPVKIERLGYGWGARISNDGKYFYYTDGVDIYCILLEELQLDI